MAYFTFIGLNVKQYENRKPYKRIGGGGGGINDTFTQNWLNGIKSDFEFFCFILVPSSDDQIGLSNVRHLIGRGL